MRTLVLGGTVFLGRAVVEAALAHGHEVTLFTRGRTNPGLFPEVEHLRGDRDGDLSALDGREWDAVVDTSGYVPRVVRASAEALAGSGFYAFVSSVSVYADLSTPPDESSPTGVLPDPETEDVTGETYGPLKAACERVVADVFPGRSLAVRAGLIVGPHDPTDRFTYWVARLARGGDVLAPEPRALRVQFVDVRDLAAWIVRMAEERRGGTFNATRPPEVTMEELLEVCRAASRSDARLVWVDAGFLREREVAQWSELPLWIVDAEYAGIHRADVSRAVAAGLAFRPLEETVRDTLAWARDAGAGVEKAGLRPEREAELLRAWRGERDT